MSLPLADRRHLAAVANEATQITYFIVSQKMSDLLGEVKAALVMGSAARRYWMIRLFDCTDPHLNVQAQHDALEQFEIDWRKRGSA